MIPHTVPLDSVNRYEQTWETISAVFSSIGMPMFRMTWLGSLIILIILVAGARFVWAWIKGGF